MKLWLLKRNRFEYCELYSCVIRAENEKEARSIAAKSCDFSERTNLEWTDSNRSTCKQILEDGPPELIHRLERD